MKNILSVLILLLLLPLAQSLNAQSLTRYVDPTIGTGDHGHVFVGANVPFGMVQLGPTSIPQTWDWCSGYHVSDSTVIGFSHTHLSGTGIGDLFDITVMPITGRPHLGRGDELDPKSGHWSYADRRHQTAEPGYYAVRLLRYDILAELTATSRVGFHRYTFPAASDAALVFDLQNGGCWDKDTEVFLEACGPKAVRGYRYSTGWAKDQRVYFYAELSKTIEGIESTNAGRQIRLNFRTSQGEQVLLKVALSPTSMDAARGNMQAELPAWNFDTTRQAAQAAWEQELSRVRIEGGSETQLRTFYTAMYHTMIAPSEFCDADGLYRGADHIVHQPDENGQTPFVNHTTYSLWDTYRAQHPLLTLIHTDRLPDIINTMLRIYDEQGKLPVWHLWGNETDCMVGNPGVCVVADAVLKGVPGINQEHAYEAMRASVMLDERGLKEYRERGYIAIEDGNENVSRTLEYALADWAVAQVARKLGKKDDYDYFLRRSQQYRNVFDPQTRFMRGRHADGTWRTPFDPFFSAHEQDDFTEGNAWQYTWLVPHDPEGLARLMGGREQFLAKLDSLFIVKGSMGKDASPDISGLIGQYAHGNEPSHHIIYLYTLLGQPRKTADLVRQVLATLYDDQPAGLSGNEDVGQMSAWYVLSALGLYQVEPAGGHYVIGSPLFQRADLAVWGGTFSIIARGNSDTCRYIKAARLNGRKLKGLTLTYDDIAQGGTLELEMTD